MDVARRLGHQGLDQRLAGAFVPVLRVNAKGAKLQAIEVRLENDKSDDFAGLLGHPKSVGFHPGIVQVQSSSELKGLWDVLRMGLPDAHFRLLYHGRRPSRTALTTF